MKNQFKKGQVLFHHKLQKVGGLKRKLFFAPFGGFFNWLGYNLELTKYISKNIFVIFKNTFWLSATTHEKDRFSQKEVEEKMRRWAKIIDPAILAKKRVQPLVSIIIPCFNKGGLIKEAVKSAEQSSYQNKEIIVVNDGSSDPVTLKSLQKIRRELPKIKILDKKNGGLSDTRNFGIKNARGKYFFFLDHDDLISQNFIQNGVEFLEKNPKIAYVYPDIVFFGELFGLKKTPKFNFETLKAYNFLHSSCLHRAEIVRRFLFNKKLLTYEDWDFLLRLGRAGFCGARLVDNYLFYRVIKSESMSHQYSSIKKQLAMAEKIRAQNKIRLNLSQKIIHRVLVYLYPVIKPPLDFARPLWLSLLLKSAKYKNLKAEIEALQIKKFSLYKVVGERPK